MEVDILNIDDENNIEIYIEPWFDVDKRLNTNIGGRDDVWVNLYARYNYQTEMLKDVVTMIDGFKIYQVIDFQLTKEEERLIISEIKKQLLDEYKCTAEEYINQKMMKI